METELPMLNKMSLCHVSIKKLKNLPKGIRVPRLSEGRRKLAKDEELQRNLRVDADLNVKPFKTAMMGLGVKARKDVKRGSFLFEYTGKVLNKDLALAKEVEYAREDHDIGSFMLWFKLSGTNYW